MLTRSGRSPVILLFAFVLPYGDQLVMPVRATEPLQCLPYLSLHTGGLYCLRCCWVLFNLLLQQMLTLKPVQA